MMCKIGITRCVFVFCFLAFIIGCTKKCESNSFPDVVWRLGSLICDYESVDTDAVVELDADGGRRIIIDVSQKHDHVADKVVDWKRVSTSLAALVDPNHDTSITDDLYLLIAYVDQVLSQGGKNDEYAISSMEAYRSFVSECPGRALEDETRQLLKRTHWLSGIEAFLSMCPSCLSESEKMKLYAQEQISGIKRMRQKMGSALKNQE